MQCTQDHAFAPLEKMSTKKRVSVQLAGFRQVHTLQGKVWIKEVLTITENNIENGFRLVVFLSDDELIFLLLFETMISQASK